MTPKELAEADQAWEEQGVGPVERAKLWQQNGYASPTGKTAAEYKRDEHAADDEKKAATEGKSDVDQRKAAAGIDLGDKLATARGLIQGPDGKWKKGGKRASDEEIEALQDQAAQALQALGQDEDAATKAVGGGHHIGHQIASFLVPFYGSLTDAVSDDDLAARLNATQTGIRARATPADKQASERGGEIRGKKVGNMREPRP
jgi:hypothetical protein